MVVYQGSKYKWPSRSLSVGVEPYFRDVSHEGGTLFMPDVSGVPKEVSGNDSHQSLSLGKIKVLQTSFQDAKNMNDEEAKFSCLLDGLGPHFVEWWGMRLLPVGANLLPQNVPSYKQPLRLLPTRMQSRLTNAEMTNLRKLARKLPCHFTLGRNRHHQGLAAAILKLWE